MEELPLWLDQECIPQSVDMDQVMFHLVQYIQVDMLLDMYLLIKEMILNMLNLFIIDIKKLFLLKTK